MDLTMPDPVQYGHGWQSTRSSACFVRLRVMQTRPNSLNESALEGALSSSRACCSADKTFSRLRRSSMSMKSTTMMPPRSRRRICRTISFTASRLVLKEIVRQIRLRDLGGIIVVDFIDMEERRNREKVLSALQQALEEDKAPSKA